MVQAYGFTPEQSTKMLDVFQHTDEGHEQKKLKTKTEWNAFTSLTVACCITEQIVTETLH